MAATVNAAVALTATMKAAVTATMNAAVVLTAMANAAVDLTAKMKAALIDAAALVADEKGVNGTEVIGAEAMTDVKTDLMRF